MNIQDRNNAKDSSEASGKNLATIPWSIRDETTRTVV